MVEAQGCPSPVRVKQWSSRYRKLGFKELACQGKA
jgi:hypothetical protein